MATHDPGTPPPPPPDALRDAVRRLAETEPDPAVRRWLKRLLTGERATSSDAREPAAATR